MIKPILHRILVKPVEIDEKDVAYAAAKRMGLEVVKTEKEREQAAIDEGIVVDFGPTAFLAFETTNPLAKGNKVVYARYAGKVIEDPVDKTKYVALNDEDVIAIITEEGA